jgi:glycosyltransferase involved in cell wall biosynthesis
VTMKINILTPVRAGGPYNWGCSLVSQLNRKGLPAEHVHKLPDLLASPFYQSADVVHAAVPLTHVCWRKPVVISVRGDQRTENIVWRLLYPMALAKADVITTVSYFMKERLGLQDAIVIPNAIFPEQFRVVKHDGKDIINLATITKFYFKDKARGILDILEILGSLPEEVRKHINYSVVGGGPYLKEVMAEAKRYDVNVQFTGTLPSPRKVLEGSDIFIYYSHQDDLPNVILEAMACGLPVVTNNVGAVGEIIENEKEGFIAANHGSYTEYLIHLIKDSGLRARVGENARKAVEARFNWETVIDKYIDIYQKLV